MHCYIKTKPANLFRFIRQRDNRILVSRINLRFRVYKRIDSHFAEHQRRTRFTLIKFVKVNFFKLIFQLDLDCDRNVRESDSRDTSRAKI